MGWGRGPEGRDVAWRAADPGFHPWHTESQVSWRTLVILALRRRQEDQTFKVILSKF